MSYLIPSEVETLCIGMPFKVSQRMRGGGKGARTRALVKVLLISLCLRRHQIIMDPSVSIIIGGCPVELPL